MRGEPVAQDAGAGAQDIVGVGRLRVEVVLVEERGEVGAEARNCGRPVGQVGGGQEVGHGGNGQPVHRPLGLAPADALDQLGVGAEHVAQAQPGAGEQLGERADDDGAVLGVAPRPAPGGELVEGLVPHAGPLVGGGQPARRVVRVGAPARAAVAARMEGEVGLVGTAADLGGDEGDGLRAAVGQQQPVGPDGDDCGQLGGRAGRIGVATERIEVLGHDLARVRRHRVEAGGQVEHRGRVDAERSGQPCAVAAVAAGRGDGHRHRRVLLPRRSAASPARPAAVRRATSPARWTAAAMSRASGGRPAPRGGRSSTRPP